jgi:hypothetical protein
MFLVHPCLVLDSIERLFWIPIFSSLRLGGKLFPNTASSCVLALENDVMRELLS